jgi:hypothetical protein
MDPNSPPIVSVPSVDVAPAISDALGQLLAFVPTLVLFAKTVVGYLIGLSLVLSVFFVIVIVYCVERLKTIRRKEEEIFENPVVPIIEPGQAGDVMQAKRWQSVKQHIDSDNPNDWRQAIIDADIVLDDLLTKLGYRGDSVGEKLKRAHKGDFVTLENAWEAHKVRNQIAHEGTHFEINHLDAKRTVDHYRKVFEEFYYI